MFVDTVVLGQLLPVCYGLRMSKSSHAEQISLTGKDLGLRRMGFCPVWIEMGTQRIPMRRDTMAARA